MRICVVTTVAHGVGGMQRHTHDLVRGLVGAGHEVEVVAPAHPSLAPDAYGARWRLIDAPPDFVDRTWQRRSAEEVERGHAERPYDVVHGEGSAALGLVRRGFHRRVALVVEFHGNYLGLARAAARRGRTGFQPALREAWGVLHLSRRHFARGNWYGFRACESIVPAHQQVADTRRSHLLDPARIHVVPNGVDTDRFRPLPKPERPRPLLVASGRLDAEKGFDVAIRATASLDADLLVVGEGPERDRLVALVRELGLVDRVTVEGPVGAEEIARIVATGDVYLFPTRREEAAPLVLPEAMACGVPVVASRIGGIPEVIDRPGENGVLVAVGDVGALVEAVSPLLADEARRRAMGERARERALAEYTLERMVERTLRVYEVAVRRAAGPGRDAGVAPR